MSEPSAEAYLATALCVVCEAYEDAPASRRLTGAREQMLGIAERLRGLGFVVRVVGADKDPDKAAFRREKEEWRTFWQREGGNGPALILWSGHGELDGQELRLVLGDLKLTGNQFERAMLLREHGVSAQELVDTAMASGADQTLLVLDTCHSGAGLAPSVDRALDNLRKTSLPQGRSKWLGVMASCRPGELGEGYGPLMEAVAQALATGPHTDHYRTAWSAHNELVTGTDLMAAVRSHWAEDKQTPERVAVGDERPAFPNPKSDPAAPPVLVEHLVLAARGVGHQEEGWFFTGRERVLGEIVGWMRTAAPGLFLVTGPAGCGKSAVLGRVATLADPAQRRRAEEQGAIREGDPDPGERPARTFAAVHMRGLDATQVAADIAAQLGLGEPRNADALRAELRDLPEPPVVVLDGLDEVPAEHTQSVIEELVFPLSRMLPVLVGSRERPFRNLLKPDTTLYDALVQHIGDSVHRVDLENEPGTRDDIAEYVRRRCEAAGVDGTEVAEALANRATAQGGGFLFARLVTGFLIARLKEGAVSADDLLAGLPDSVEAAFEEDLRGGARRNRADGTELPSAARDLLTALAWAAGRGMPAGGVWETVASALGGEGVCYDEADVDWVLAEYGRYIVEDSAGPQAVYRLYHREFVTHLRKRKGPTGAAAATVVLRAIVDLLRRQAEVGHWERVDPYVQTWLARHAVWASTPGPGIDLLRELAEWDSDNARPLLAEALLNLATTLSESAQHTAALELSQEAVDVFRDVAEADPAHLPDLAGSLNNHAAYLANIGDRLGALEPVQEAVRHYTQLADNDPTAHLADLAMALNNLAAHMADAGDRRGALAPAQEAVRHYTQLAETNLTAYLPDLASALNNLASHLAGTGDRQGALAPAQEAVRIRRHLVRTNPAAYNPDLAASLNNLANHLADTGDRRGALEHAQEAVRIRRQLAHTHPAAYLPDLATSLNNLSNRLADHGDRQGALAPAREAVQHYTQLAHTNAAAYLPNLAMALNNLAAHLAGIGDRRGALEPAQEAVRIRRHLAHTNPAAYLPDLAGSLNNLANHLADLGDRQGALEPAQEAVHHYTQLAETNPAAHLPDLAMALNNLASHLADLGDRQGALEPAQEAVRIRRHLARTNPAAYLPDLASSLNNLSNRLADAGDRQGALEHAREAVQHHTQLADTNPAAHLPNLAMALNNLANRLAGTGDPQGALEAAHRAVQHYTQLADSNPAAHLSDLAMALNNYAAHLAGVGDRQGALEPAREALRHYTQLAETNPAAHLPNLAGSLNNLAAHLAGVGDRQGALEPAQEAVRHYTQLAGANPAAYLHDLVMALNNLAAHLADTGNESASLRAYTSAAGELATAHPAAASRISYEREVFRLGRPEPNRTVGLRELIRMTVGESPDRPGDVTVRARQTLRNWARKSPSDRDLLDREWQGETGRTAPDWLSLPQETLDLVLGWVNTPSWADSRAFWTRHSEVLASDDASIALAELALAWPVAAQHQVLREAVLSEGRDAAFQPLIVMTCLQEWLTCETWDSARSFLQENGELLLEESAEALLASVEPMTTTVVVHLALLHIARTEGIDIAFQCVQDRGALRDYVSRAVDARDAHALARAAAIEGSVFDDQPSASAHTQAALLLTGDTEALEPDALASAVAEADPATRNRLTAELAVLSTRHGQEHMSHWMRLIQALTQDAQGTA
ncbi:tetratricopeptide repeat protein [Streptomyces sp. NPDC001595]|uniref:tetratricopeptide repeat protein n=1 Tax=Streptomyces sp. NPDC001532 TaxID=3154520 RepID=UPI0033340AE7